MSAGLLSSDRCQSFFISIDFGAFNSTVCNWDTALPEHKKIQFYVEDSGEENEAWSKSVRYTRLLFSPADICLS